jgi:hypothetical protein
MNITNTIVITAPVIVEEVVEPAIYATVYWTVLDGAWTYMDTYYYTETKWNSTTPTDLQNRQVAQYVAWREYCQAPVTDMSEITSTTIEEVI